MGSNGRGSMLCMGDVRQCGVVVQGNIGESNGACTTDSGRRAVWRRWPAHVACIATRGVVAQGDCTCDVLTAMTLATPPRTSACIIDLCAGLGILLHSRSCLGLFKYAYGVRSAIREWLWERLHSVGFSITSSQHWTMGGRIDALCHVSN